VVYDSKKDSDWTPPDGPIIDRYKEGYKEAMRDVWRWADGYYVYSVYRAPLKEFIQSQIKQAEGVNYGK